jgi:peptidoglycan/xylan/chitin deacetylase (PgdA/CDA1 family)
LIDLLAVDHTFISHSEATQRLQRGPIDRPYVSLSFDDGFASNARTGRLLAQRGIQACFFITTNFIGTQGLADARAFFRGSVGVDEAALTWDQVESLLGFGHEIGNHTQSHLALAQLSRTQVEDEIGGAAATLERRLGSRPTHFAWPYGQLRHANGAVPSVAFATGHETCASAVRGAHACTASSTGVAKPFIRRDHMMAEWPLRHALYFIGRSARSAEAMNNEWPWEWSAPSNGREE